jgi:hypothetical protein
MNIGIKLLICEENIGNVKSSLFAALMSYGYYKDKVCFDVKIPKKLKHLE